MDRFEISTLRSYYGALLTKRQDEILRLRYDEDMSLGEIAEEFDVSRQTVLDAIVKGEKRLEEIDSALGLISRDSRIARQLDRISDGILQNDDEEIIAAVNQIKLIMEE